MAAVRSTCRPYSRLIGVGAVAVTVAWCGGMTPALSAGSGNANVIVDLSVIDAAAPDVLSAGLADGRSGQLLLREPGQLVSRLHVPRAGLLASGKPSADSPAAGYGGATIPYGRLIVPPARTPGTGRGRSAALTRPGTLFGKSGLHAGATAVPRSSSGSPGPIAPTAANAAFPPPPGFAGDRSSTARGPALPGTAAPDAMVAFAPPEPLVVAAGEAAAPADATTISGLSADSPMRSPGSGAPAASAESGQAYAAAALRTAALTPASPAAKPDDDIELAAVPPLNEAREGARFRLIYAADQVEMSLPIRRDLEPVVTDLRKKDALRVRLAAYAGAIDESTSKARRTSLSRALAIRSYLIDNGIKASRIDVRALGHNSGASAPERVDVEIIDK